MKYGFTQLYRYFDKDNNLLYVGISFSAAVRASEHRRTSAWYSSAVKMTMENFDTRKECELAEIILICPFRYPDQYKVITAPKRSTKKKH